LANFKGPSFVFQVIIAFLLPILIFIASLAAFERILTKAVDTKQMQIILSFALAFLVTFAVVSITKAINIQFGKNR